MKRIPTLAMLKRELAQATDPEREGVVLEEPCMLPRQHPRGMKMIPLRWRGVGVGCSRREGPTPEGTPEG